MNTPKKAGRSKRSKAVKQLTPAELFFYDHAGYSWNPKTQTPEQGRIECARALARARDYAWKMNWEYEWVQDDNACSGCDCGSPECDCSTGSPHETLGCVLKDEDGKTLESLWGICKPSREYGRVVEAELACEAMPANPESEPEEN